MLQSAQPRDDIQQQVTRAGTDQTGPSGNAAEHDPEDARPHGLLATAVDRSPMIASR